MEHGLSICQSPWAPDPEGQQVRTCGPSWRLCQMAGWFLPSFNSYVPETADGPAAVLPSQIHLFVYAARSGICVQSLSHVRLCDPRTVAHQAPVSTGFSRQEYWRGLLFLSPEDLPNPGIEPGSPTLQTDSLPTELFGLVVKNPPEQRSHMPWNN